MLSSRPARRSALALLTTLGLAAATLPAAGATTGHPATGVASSSLTILQLNLSGTTVSAGRLAAVAADTAVPHIAKIVVTPLDSSLTGPLGRQTVTPSTAPATVPGTPKSVSLPSNLGKVTGPTFAVKAVDGTTRVLTSAELSALGKVRLLTVPLDLRAASLSNVARVTSTGAVAKKTLSLGHLGLPSLDDLLAALGVDVPSLLGRLTQGNLTKLVGLVTSTTTGAVAAANDAVDTAQAGISGTVPATLTKATSALLAAKGDKSAAKTALTQANDAFDTAIAAIPAASLTGLGVPANLTAGGFLALTGALQTAVDALTSADLGALATAVQTAQDALATANDVVDSVQALVDALTQLINTVLSKLAASDDPLASLGSISVVTKALAARTPVAKADVSVGSIHVLGAAIPLGALTSTLGQVTDTLSSVLDSVAGVSFTAPTIAVGAPVHQTSKKGRTRYASASVSAVDLRLPSITLPAALRLPGVPTGISGRLRVGTVAETAQWTPAVAGSSGGTPSTPTTPTSSGPQPSAGGSLPDTGGRAVLPLVALLLVGSGLALRRRVTRAA